jgi:WD40 repeat protein
MNELIFFCIYVKVNDAAFELDGPAPDNFLSMPKYTNLCATCGLNIVNIIDVNSGKIVKRFNDEVVMNRTKEVYNKVAWTHTNGTSILVAGGLHGQVKIILPKFSMCISKIDAHASQIYGLKFHYKYSNILLTSSDDHRIHIWKLNFKEAEKDLEWECAYE